MKLRSFALSVVACLAPLVPAASSAQAPDGPVARLCRTQQACRAEADRRLALLARHFPTRAPRSQLAPL